MKTRIIDAPRLFALAIAAALPGTVWAEGGDDAAFFKQKGFVVVAETFADEPVFEGCEVGMRVPLDNGQTFECAVNGEIPLEVYPEVVILRHPASGEVKVVIATYEFPGTLHGAPSLPPAPPPGARTAAMPPIQPPPPGAIPPPAAPAVMAPPAVAPAVAAKPFLDMTPMAPPPVTPAGATTAPPPGPKPFPSSLAAPVTPATAPPPSPIRLVAPITGTWRTSAIVSGSQVDAVAMLDEDGNFNRFERWSFGFTVQVWGTYNVAPISPTKLQLTQRPTGWEPKQWCVRGGLCTTLSYPETAAQFTFLDANTIRDDNTQAVYRRE